MNANALATRWALRLTLVLGLVPASAQVYTWTDADGKRHFSDSATRPKDQATPQVKVPPPNVANRFEPRSTARDLPAENHGEEGQALTPPAPVIPSNPSRSLSGVQRSQNSCRAQWDAYYDGADCFAGCGKTLGFFGTRNNAGCGHCTDAPRPNC